MKNLIKSSTLAILVIIALINVGSAKAREEFNGNVVYGDTAEATKYVQTDRCAGFSQRNRAWPWQPKECHVLVLKTDNNGLENCEYGPQVDDWVCDASIPNPVQQAQTAQQQATTAPAQPKDLGYPSPYTVYEDDEKAILTLDIPSDDYFFQNGNNKWAVEVDCGGVFNRRPDRYDATANNLRHSLSFAMTNDKPFFGLAHDCEFASGNNVGLKVYRNDQLIGTSSYAVSSGSNPATTPAGPPARITISAPTPSTIFEGDDEANFTITIPSKDFSSNAKWEVQVDCGTATSKPERYSAQVGSNSISISYKNSPPLNGLFNAKDCQFAAGENVGLIVYKDGQEYGITGYKVERGGNPSTQPASGGQSQPGSNILSAPTPQYIYEDDDSAAFTIGIPPSDFSSTSKWEVDVDCSGWFNKHPDRYTAVPGINNITISFNNTKPINGWLGARDCQFSSGDNVGLIVYKDGVKYGQTGYNVRKGAPAASQHESGLRVLNAPVPDTIYEGDDEATFVITVPSEDNYPGAKWEVQPECGGLFSRKPDRITPKVEGDTLTITIGKTLNFLRTGDCQFANGSNVGLRVFKNDQAYGITGYYVEKGSRPAGSPGGQGGAQTPQTKAICSIAADLTTGSISFKAEGLSKMTEYDLYAILYGRGDIPDQEAPGKMTSDKDGKIDISQVAGINGLDLYSGATVGISSNNRTVQVCSASANVGNNLTVQQTLQQEARSECSATPISAKKFSVKIPILPAGNYDVQLSKLSGEHIRALTDVQSNITSLETTVDLSSDPDNQYRIVVFKRDPNNPNTSLGSYCDKVVKVPVAQSQIGIPVGTEASAQAAASAASRATGGGASGGRVVALPSILELVVNGRTKEESSFPKRFTTKEEFTMTALLYGSKDRIRDLEKDRCVPTDQDLVYKINGQTIKPKPQGADVNTISADGVANRKACQPFRASMPESAGTYTISVALPQDEDYLKAAESSATFQVVAPQQTQTTVGVSSTPKQLGVATTSATLKKQTGVKRISLSGLLNRNVAGVAVVNQGNGTYSVNSTEGGANTIFVNACTTSPVSSNKPEFTYLTVRSVDDNENSQIIEEGLVVNCEPKPVDLGNIDNLKYLVIDSHFDSDISAEFASSDSSDVIVYTEDPNVNLNSEPTFVDLRTDPETIGPEDQEVTLIGVSNNPIDNPNFEVNGQNFAADYQDSGCENGGNCEYHLTLSLNPETDYQIRFSQAQSLEFSTKSEPQSFIEQITGEPEAQQESQEVTPVAVEVFVNGQSVDSTETITASAPGNVLIRVSYSDGSQKQILLNLNKTEQVAPPTQQSSCDDSACGAYWGDGASCDPASGENRGDGCFGGTRQEGAVPPGPGQFPPPPAADQSNCSTSCGINNADNCTNQSKADSECTNYWREQNQDERDYSCSFDNNGPEGDGCIPQ